ncbi:hypothetical protein J6590_068106 [Homalodisca vitripennis]|nr:hypothetical protein J6590_068106 [Homalodisca vitripennis]
MSAPFYTSEKLESDNPKWADVEINQVNGAANVTSSPVHIDRWQCSIPPHCCGVAPDLRHCVSTVLLHYLKLLTLTKQLLAV